MTQTEVFIDSHRMLVEPDTDNPGYVKPSAGGGGGGGGIVKSQFFADQNVTVAIPVGGGVLTWDEVLEKTAIGVTAIDGGGVTIVPAPGVSYASFFNIDDVVEGLYVFECFFNGLASAPGTTDGTVKLALGWQDSDGKSVSDSAEFFYSQAAIAASGQSPSFSLKTRPIWLSGKALNFPTTYSIVHAAVVWTPVDGVSELDPVGGSFTRLSIMRLAGGV